MRVIDIFTGRDLSEDEIGARALAASPERAAREALADAIALLDVQRGAPEHEGQPPEFFRALTLARSVVTYAAESNGVSL